MPFVEMLARKCRARVTLLHVVSPPEHPGPGGEPSLEDILKHAGRLAEHYLREQQRRLVLAEVDTHVAVVTGSPARELVAYARREGCDAIALTTHGRSGPQRWAHGSVAEAVLQLASVPVLLVRPDEGWVAAPRAINRVVVPLDGSAVAASALPVAEPLARLFGVPLVVVRFVEPVVDFAAGPGGMGMLDVVSLTEELLAAARRDNDRMVSELRARGLAAHAEVGVGSAANGIAAHARQHEGSLIVMTTHGRTGWRRLLLGSVARRAVQMASAPILLCPPPPSAMEE